jgi:hypothetical protein
MLIACDENCQGGEGCVNKKIKKFGWKKVIKMKRNGKDYGLIADQDIKKDEFIINYMGKIVNDDPMNKYGMKYKGFNLWINESRMNTLTKYMNHSCIPNCVNKIWAIKGLPCL